MHRRVWLLALATAALGREKKIRSTTSACPTRELPTTRSAHACNGMCRTRSPRCACCWPHASPAPYHDARVAGRVDEICDTVKLTGVQKQSEATLLHVRVERFVRRIFMEVMLHSALHTPEQLLQFRIAKKLPTPKLSRRQTAQRFDGRLECLVSFLL